MRTISECLDDLEDDDFVYTETLTSFMCELQVEGMLKELARACLNERNDDILLAGKSLGNSINAYMIKRAESLSMKSRTPLEEPVTAYDVRKYG